jgi:hypothetical protein
MHNRGKYKIRHQWIAPTISSTAVETKTQTVKGAS